MKPSESKTKRVPRGVRLSELAAVLDFLPRLSPEEAEAFAADIDEVRRKMGRLEVHRNRRSRLSTSKRKTRIGACAMPMGTRSIGICGSRRRHARCLA